jgi:hypothetical protein
MKRYLPLAAMLVIAFASLCVAQPQDSASPSPSPKPKPRISKAQLLKQLSASETKLWEAWKNKDPKPFQATLAANGVMIGERGVADKDSTVKEIAGTSCEVKSFALSDWKLSMIDADAAVLTYKAVVEGTCAGTPIPTVWSSSVWVRSRGRWRAFAHQETPAK